MNKSFESIKKGTELYTKHLGTPCRAISMESIKQGRGFKNTLLVDVKGSEIGLFDECGSIYVKDIIAVINLMEEDNA
tara:strand:+ start:1853 stop:2083 length:231 start_codon:yes stop_codon:yes gene_type:complete